MSALATQADLDARLGRPLTAQETARAGALLDDASAEVRAFTRQDFTAETGKVQVLRAVGDRITLPQRPVAEVTKVEAIGGSDAVPDFTVVDWSFDGIDTIRIGDGAVVINLPEAWWDDDGHPGTFRVTYTPGYATVPADVLAVVCGMVLRVLTAPTMAGGVTSETIGSYSYRLDTPNSGLQVTLSEDDKRRLKRYRRDTSTVQVVR